MNIEGQLHLNCPQQTTFFSHFPFSIHPAILIRQYKVQLGHYEKVDATELDAYEGKASKQPRRNLNSELCTETNQILI